MLNWTRDGNIIRLSGQLDKDNAHLLWEARESLLSKGGCLDLSGLDRTDSAGLAALVALLAWAHRNSLSVELASPSPQLLALARVSGVQDILPFATPS
jgi:phospholipid transport system transporter-binding protein